jgi:hypothetical protein
MKRFILAVLLVSSTSFAVENPDVMKLKNGVTFQHKNHQATLKGECKNCHRKEKDVSTGHIEGFGKDNAHRMCRTCHTVKNMGPTSCKDCHKKS